VTITPVPTTNIVGAQTVVLNLLTNSGYLLGTPTTATLSLAGNTVRPLSFRITPSGANLVWPNVSNAVYQIACKNNLTDSTWTKISGNLTTLNVTNAWLDTNASTAKQRFYIIARVQ
jgi:hypothetical protein